MSIESGGRSPSRFFSQLGYAVLHVQRELAPQVGIESLQRLVETRLVGGDEIEIPLRHLAVAIDPFAPSVVANAAPSADRESARRIAA